MRWKRRSVKVKLQQIERRLKRPAATPTLTSGKPLCLAAHHHDILMLIPVKTSRTSVRSAAPESRQFPQTGAESRSPRRSRQSPRNWNKLSSVRFLNRPEEAIVCSGLKRVSIWRRGANVSDDIISVISIWAMKLVPARPISHYFSLYFSQNQPVRL